jgi:hypothetical protein
MKKERDMAYFLDKEIGLIIIPKRILNIEAEFYILSDGSRLLRFLFCLNPIYFKGEIGCLKRKNLNREGLQKLEDELEHLKSVKRKEVAERISRQSNFGDISENSEYEDAKNEQALHRSGQDHVLGEDFAQ